MNEITFWVIMMKVNLLTFRFTCSNSECGGTLRVLDVLDIEAFLFALKMYSLCLLLTDRWSFGFRWHSFFHWSTWQCNSPTWRIFGKDNATNSSLNLARGEKRHLANYWGFSKNGSASEQKVQSLSEQTWYSMWNKLVSKSHLNYKNQHFLKSRMKN